MFSTYVLYLRCRSRLSRTALRWDITRHPAGRVYKTTCLRLRQSQINLSPTHLTAGKAAYFSACEGFLNQEPEPHISSTTFQFLT